MRFYAFAILVALTTPALADDPPAPVATDPPAKTDPPAAPVITTQEVPRAMADVGAYIADVSHWPTLLPPLFGADAPQIDANVTPYKVEDGVGKMTVRSASGVPLIVTLSLRPAEAQGHTLVECYLYYIPDPARPTPEIQNNEARLATTMVSNVATAMQPRAQFVHVQPPPPEPMLPRRYGAHMGIADAIATGLGLTSSFIAATITDQDARFAVSLIWPISFSIAGPIVHLIHEHPDRALISLGMRSAGWIAGLAMIRISHDDITCNEDCLFGWSTAGWLTILAGMAISTALDYTLLTKEAPKQNGPTVTLLPTGIAGTF